MKNRPLTPIKENAEAQIIPPSRSVMDPDNQILFLNNGERIVNPINAKTPPPPFWGEVLEEENYDPNEPFYDDEKAQRDIKRKQQMEEKLKAKLGSKKLKRKVVYVYESDSDNEENKKEQTEDQDRQNRPLKSSQLTQSLVYNKADKGVLFDQSRRGVSNDGIVQSRSSNNFQYNTRLPTISSQMAGFNVKPPLPQSLKKNIVQNTSSTASTRQIRTGGFQRLPSIGLQIVKS